MVRESIAWRFTLREIFRQMRGDYLAFGVAVAIVGGALLIGTWRGTDETSGETSEQTSTPDKIIKGKLQARPGGPVEEHEIKVHTVPVDLPSFPASEANLKDDDLVVGIVVEGQAMAYPIRYLAQYEVVDHRVGEIPVAPTW